MNVDMNTDILSLITEVTIQPRLLSYLSIDSLFNIDNTRKPTDFEQSQLDNYVYRDVLNSILSSISLDLGANKSIESSHRNVTADISIKIYDGYSTIVYLNKLENPVFKLDEPKALIWVCELPKS